MLVIKMKRLFYLFIYNNYRLCNLALKCLGLGVFQIVEFFFPPFGNIYIDFTG